MNGNLQTVEEVGVLVTKTSPRVVESDKAPRGLTRDIGKDC